MTADLVARLERRAANPYDMTDMDGLANDLREAASAMRSSGEAVAWRVVREDGSDYYTTEPFEDSVVKAIYAHHGEIISLYLHPATPASAPEVTDEDVERAMDAFAKLPANHNSSSWDRECMRAALESFVRPTPPTSTKGG